MFRLSIGYNHVSSYQYHQHHNIILIFRLYFFFSIILILFISSITPLAIMAIGAYAKGVYVFKLIYLHVVCGTRMIYEMIPFILNSIRSHVSFQCSQKRKRKRNKHF